MFWLDRNNPDDQRAFLEHLEFFIGDRDASVSSPFAGKYCIRHADGWVIVGDDLPKLIQDAFCVWYHEAEDLQNFKRGLPVSLRNAI